MEGCSPKIKIKNILNKGGHVMKKAILITISLFNIYSNGLSMMNNLQDLCSGGQGAVMGVTLVHYSLV